MGVLISSLDLNGMEAGGGTEKNVEAFLTFIRDEVKMEINFAPFHLHFKNRETPLTDISSARESCLVSDINPQDGLVKE